MPDNFCNSIDKFQEILFASCKVIIEKIEWFKNIGRLMNNKFFALLGLLVVMPGCGWRYQCTPCNTPCNQPSTVCYDAPAEAVPQEATTTCYEEPATECSSVESASTTQCYDVQPEEATDYSYDEYAGATDAYAPSSEEIKSDEGAFDDSDEEFDFDDLDDLEDFDA